MELQQRRIRALADRQDGVLTAAQAVAAGLDRHDVRTRVRRGEWAALLRGVYLVDTDVYGEQVPRRSWLRAAALMHPDGALGLSSAAELLGLQGLGWPDRPVAGPQHACSEARCPGRPPELVLPPGREGHQQRHLQLHVWPLAPAEVVDVDGMRVTAPLRTLADLVPRLDRPCALSILDSALHMGAVTTDELPLAEALAAGRPGCRHVRDLWSIADGAAASPLESRVRLACIDHGVPPDVLQVPVHNRWGDVLGYGDLGWHRRRRNGRLLVAECDGAAPHGLPYALFRDRQRLNDFTSAECDQLRFTWADAMRPAYVASMIRTAL